VSLITTLLESVATLKRPTISRDSRSGVVQDPFKILATNVPCSVQEAGSSVQAIYAQRSAVANVTVYFVSDPEVEPSDRIEATNKRTNTTVYLNVQGEATSDTRGRLWSVDCQLIRAP
jgi:hypothetical protein